VAKVEGENPNIEEVNAPDESLVQADGMFEATTESTLEVDEATDAEPVAESSEAVETQPTEAEESPKDAEEEQAPSKLPMYLEIAGLVCIPLMILALWWLDYLYPSTALYLFGLCLIPYGIWKGRETNTVYTVFLGCVLAAILTALYCLWMELGRYQFDIKARDAKQRVGMLQPFEPGLLAQGDRPLQRHA